MEKKKQVFEHVSAEEAKKIRAYGGGESMTSGSGSLCPPSGATDPWAVCQLKHEGEKCCYRDHAGMEVYGTCVFGGGFGEVNRLKCVERPISKK